ncbi:hypothetical protein RI845_11995 [Thalassotalea nanhaiensis]|uniref:DUF3012 domain-containing protein n=1 Tax=Thalassotalea nanhaiensis TaxID=3065648 RepID=A0ABY9TF53_9GAMM|nr:hypothetical protein RI845_11995 [Colwelliaceae bacterium SQ345]
MKKLMLLSILLTLLACEAEKQKEKEEFNYRSCQITESNAPTYAEQMWDLNQCWNPNQTFESKEEALEWCANRVDDYLGSSGYSVSYEIAFSHCRS